MQTKYMAIAAHIRTAIDNGTYRPGHQIPTEAELMKTHDASRPTVKRGLDLLRHERRITSIPGCGTFVLAPRPPQTEHPDITRLRTWLTQHTPEAMANDLANPIDVAIRLLARRATQTVASEGD